MKMNFILIWRRRWRWRGGCRDMMMVRTATSVSTSFLFVEKKLPRISSHIYHHCLICVFLNATIHLPWYSLSLLSLSASRSMCRFLLWALLSVFVIIIFLVSGFYFNGELSFSLHYFYLVRNLCGPPKISSFLQDLCAISLLPSERSLISFGYKE